MKRTLIASIALNVILAACWFLNYQLHRKANNLAMAVESNDRLSRDNRILARLDPTNAEEVKWARDELLSDLNNAKILRDLSLRTAEGTWVPFQTKMIRELSLPFKDKAEK